MLVLGGEGGARLGDLWAYRPADDRWSLVEPSGPAPRQLAGHSAVWDPTGAEMLVFGGYGGAAEDRRLRAYRPAENRWVGLDPEGPAPFPRGHHTAVWDSSTNQMLVFAGIGPSFDLLDDVWAYQPSRDAWAPLPPEGLRPLPVLFHSAVWDPTGQMLVFGGVDPLSGRPVDELWSFRPSPSPLPEQAGGAWTRLEVEGPRPQPRLSHRAVWDHAGRQMLVFGGSCGAACFLHDVWAYRPEENSWLELPQIGERPPPRGGHTAVWEPAARRVLIFGGSAGDNALSDVWSYQPATYAWTRLARQRVGFQAFTRHRAVWDAPGQEMLVYETLLGRLFRYRPADNTWTELVPQGPVPGPREDPSVVWDEQGHRLVLFGGREEGVFLDDVWAYQPRENAWARLSAVGPGPPGRFRHAAVWDPSGHMLVFGGYREGPLADLWSYRPAINVISSLSSLAGEGLGGGGWIRLDPEGERPPARSEHAAVWDPEGQRMLLLGGLRGDVLGDLWAYTPAANTWARLGAATSQGPRRFSHSAVWNPENGEMLVVGGFGGGEPHEIWSYRPREDRWTRRSLPGSSSPARGAHSAVWDGAGRRLLLFTGYRGGVPNDLWSFRPTANVWKQPLPLLPSPTARQGHSMVLDGARRQILMFGGARGASGPLDDLWSYRPGWASWAPLQPEGPRPEARRGHAAAWDAAGQRMVVFGGVGAGGPLDDVWLFESTRGRWRPSLADPGPSPREEPSAVWDPRRGRLLVFGGARDGRALGDLWGLDPEEGVWVLFAAEGPSPPARFRHAAVWDPDGDVMLVFGGYGGDFPGRYLNDVWAYDPATNSWTELPSAGQAPPPRARHVAAWDPSRRRLLIFGGYAGGVDYLGDLWSYQPESGRWETLIASRMPPARAGHAAAWDEATAALLVFGGSGGSLSDELWVYHER